MAGASDIRAGRAFVELGVEGIEQVKAKLATFGSLIKTIGSTLALGFAVNKITDWASSFADGAREIYLQSRQLQMSVEQVQELGKVSRELGLEQDAMAMAINKSRQYIAGLAIEGKNTDHTLETLGLTVAQLANMDDLDRLQLLGERIRGLGNKEMTSRIGRQIFGRAGVGVAAASADIKAARESIAGGFMLNSEQVAQGFELSKAMRQSAGAIAGMGKAIGAVLAPGLSTIYRTIEKIAKSVSPWLVANSKIIEQIAVGVGLVVAFGTALLAVSTTVTVIGFAFSGIVTLIGGVVGLVGFLFSPFMLVVGAAAALAYNMLRGTEVFARLRASFGEFGNTITTTFGGIAAALSAGDIQLAFDILVAGMKVAWFGLETWMQQSFGTTFTDMFAGIRSAWVETIAFLNRQWLNFNQAGETAGTAIGNAVNQASRVPSWARWAIAGALAPISGGVSLQAAGLVELAGGNAVSADVAAASNAQNNASQQAANAERTRQLAQIEAERVAARARIMAAAGAANPQAELDAAQQQLRELTARANQARLEQQQQGGSGWFFANPANLQRGLNEFAERGGGARGTFNREAINGLGGSPFARLEERAQQQVDELRRIREALPGTGMRVM